MRCRKQTLPDTGTQSNFQHLLKAFDCVFIPKTVIPYATQDILCGAFICTTCLCFSVRTCGDWAIVLLRIDWYVFCAVGIVTLHNPSFPGHKCPCHNIQHAEHWSLTLIQLIFNAVSIRPNTLAPASFTRQKHAWAYIARMCQVNTGCLLTRFSLQHCLSLPNI